ncbi:hypothetical protein KUCAC02_025803 [Chaenocephalus aceratus]|uniref:Uncharacterized protein n=1 Tax=Chaenocephalus aceratus TaxID=36190 RepID=A0ACB9VVI6_CHAAC|nr:hypothetical protein KUCAC02_025803 [Chaenocephalus aceratus]
MGKFTNLNVGGWESTTLEEVKEAVLPTTPASPEHLQLNYEIMNARFTRLEMDIWQPLQPPPFLEWPTSDNECHTKLQGKG